MISLLHAQLVLPRYSTISEVSQFHDRECHRANYLLASFILNHLDVTEVFTITQLLLKIHVIVAARAVAFSSPTP